MLSSRSTSARPCSLIVQLVLTWWEGNTEHGRRGYRCHPRPELPGGRRVPRATAAVRPARVPAHLARHGARDGLGVDDDDLSSVGGLTNGARRGRHRPGARAPERARPVRMAQPRPRRDRRVARRISTDTWFDYFHINSIEHRRRRQLPGVRPQHLGDLQDRPRERRDHLAAGGKKSDFTMGRAPGSPGSTTRATHGADDQLVSLFDDGAAPQVQRIRGTRPRPRRNGVRATLHKRSWTIRRCSDAPAARRSC